MQFNKKKRRLCNASKQKLSENNQKPKIVAISFVDNLGIEDLLILTPKLILDSIVDIAGIDANAYCAARNLKWAQVFAISMRDLEF